MMSLSRNNGHEDFEDPLMRPGLGTVRERASRRDDLFELESALVDPAVRRSPDRLEALLHPDFIELGSSGRVYDRQMIVEMMGQEVSGDVIIRDFETRDISEDTVLVTYRSIGQTGEEARRSSIWVKASDCWQIHFHQGTRIPNRWGGVS
jgi:hypothetical protein